VQIRFAKKHKLTFHIRFAKRLYRIIVYRSLSDSRRFWFVNRGSRSKHAVLILIQQPRSISYTRVWLGTGSFVFLKKFEARARYHLSLIQKYTRIVRRFENDGKKSPTDDFRITSDLPITYVLWIIRAASRQKKTIVNSILNRA